MERNRKLPPLGALRAFEAGARLESFTLAAAELHVTQTAISHQVKLLENFYNKKLFDRQKRQLSLTEAGEILADVLTDLLDQLEQTSTELLCDKPSPLRITTPPAFGSYWLAPRLGEFWTKNPVALNLIPSAERLDFRAHDIDIGIRVGQGSWPGLVSEYLMPFNSVPVCSPKLFDNTTKLENFSDLQNFPLIHELSYQPWREWLAAHDAEHVQCERGIICQDPAMGYELALRAQGIALLSVELVAEPLANGELVAPFGDRECSETAFYLIYREQSLQNRGIQAFREYILQKAEQATK